MVDIGATNHAARDIDRGDKYVPATSVDNVPRA